MVLNAQRAMNQQGEDLLGEIGIGTDGLGLRTNAFDHDALASGVAHDRAHGGLCCANLASLGQAGTDCRDDLGIDDIEFCSQS